MDSSNDLSLSIDEDDMATRAEEQPAQSAMEQAQKDAAEERLEEGGYNG